MTSDYNTEQFKKSNSVISFNSPFKSIDSRSSTSSVKKLSKSTFRKKAQNFEVEKGNHQWVDFNESFSFCNIEKSLQE